MDINNPEFDPAEEYNRFKQWFADYSIKQNAGILDMEYEIDGQQVQFRFEYKIDPYSALSLYLEEVCNTKPEDSFKKSNDLWKIWEIGGISPPISQK